MGFKKTWYDIIWFIFLCFLILFPSSLSASIESFTGFLHNYANSSLSTPPRTGVLHNVSLPSNFSGVQVSYIRLRSNSFWVNGANFSSVFIPPKVLPIPFVKRIAIVYENLGNWSSHFYQVPSGYAFVAPVIGFTVYDSSNSSTMGSQKLHLRAMGDPISVMFSKAVLNHEKEDDVLPLCVRFEDDGFSFVLKNMSGLYSCVVNDSGHFSLVIPISIPQKKKGLVWEWWVVGFGVGLIGLAFLGLVLVVVLRFLRIQNIKKMEKESEKGVSFDTVWIGRNKMPSAAMIRTQPVLENNYVP